MATKGCDSTTHHHSSIALLQERFRQLQRAKEMRKEKELLRLFSESERTINPATKRYEPTGLFFHSDSLLPHPHPHPHPHHHSRAQPSHHQSSIYIQPNLQAKQGGFQGADTGPMFANYINGSAMSSNNRAYNNLEDYSDVDTSLHL